MPRPEGGRDHKEASDRRQGPRHAGPEQWAGSGRFEAGDDTIQFTFCKGDFGSCEQNRLGGKCASRRPVRRLLVVQPRVTEALTRPGQ
jgi:hypothetical protein